MLAWLAALLVGCGPAPTGVATFPDLKAPSGDRSVALHTTPGRFRIEAPSLPGLDAIDDRFVLEVEEVPNPDGSTRSQKVLRAKLPFNVPGGRFAPPGLTIEIDGQPIAFERGKAALSTKSSWRINGKHLVFSHHEVPAPGAVVARWPGLREKLARRDLAASGLLPQDFVKMDVTLGGETRHGIMLPAPTVAEWDLDLPEGTRDFDTWLALERALLPEPTPDPATVVLSVVAGDEVTELGRRVVKRDDPGFGRWTVDLSAYAGRSVTLRVATEPGENPWFDQVFLGSPTVRAKAGGEVRHVVVLAMDTTRPDHFGFNGYARSTTPELDAIGRQSVVFDRTWSVAPRTRPAFRSATTGRLPLDAVGATNLAELFQRDGFATAGIVANVHLQPRFDFDHGFDWWHYENSVEANVQVDRALAWLSEHQDQDTFLFLHFMDPHMPYRAPGAWKDKFVADPDPTLPERYDRFVVNRWSKNGAISEQRKAHIEGLHDGELAFMSAEIGRFFQGLDALGGRSLSVLHTDHGEEFWDHGGFEHNHTLYDETTRVLLWWRPGGGLQQGVRRSEPASLMDLTPTVIDLLGFADPPETDGVSLAPLILGEAANLPDRPLPVGYLQYDSERWGVVWHDHKYVLHTASGAEELYDLKADPEETRNLAATSDLAPYREALARAHEVPVRPGLRLFVALAPGSPAITVTLPEPFYGVGVLDPETALDHRSNQEWGEPPRRTADQVGAVEMALDRRSFTFFPGSEGNGILWVQGEAPIDPATVTLVRGVEPLALAPSPDGPRWGDASGSVRIAAGPVLVPPPGEAERMGITPKNAISDEERRKLCELGYLGSDCE